MQLVGDDLFVTNTERLKRGIDERGRELDPDQGQPDRDARPRRSPRSGWRARPATPPSCRTAQARPRTSRSPISRSRAAAGRSRPARRRAPIGSRSTTSCCGSRRRSARRRVPRPPGVRSVSGAWQEGARHVERRVHRMPHARQARTSSHRSRTATAARPRPQSLELRGPISRVRWDRLGRTALLLVFASRGGARRAGRAELRPHPCTGEQQDAIVRATRAPERRPRPAPAVAAATQTIVSDARELGHGAPGRAAVRGRQRALGSLTLARERAAGRRLRGPDRSLAEDVAGVSAASTPPSAVRSSGLWTRSSRELRRRLGEDFATDELARLYLQEGTDWCFEMRNAWRRPTRRRGT